MIALILRFVVILFIFAFIVYVMKAITRLSFNVRNTAKELRKIREQATGVGQASAKNTQMLRCVACGAFVTANDAVQIVSAGRSQTFCSHECLQLHAKTA